MRATAWVVLLLSLVSAATASAEEDAAAKGYDADEWAALPDDDARATVEKLRAAAVDNDAKALIALAGKNGVSWLGKKLNRKRLAARLDEQGVPGFIGLPPDEAWRIEYGQERPDEILIGHAGESADRVVRLERRKRRWQVAEIRTGLLPAVKAARQGTVVLVLDRSGSMSGEKMEAAKEAARAAVEVLEPDDMVAVIVFDNTATTIVALQKASNRLRITTDIARLQPGGGTDVAAGLAAAEKELASSTTTRKHVILLSDGQSSYDGIADRVDAMRTGGATVSAIGIGDADRNLLQLIAEHGDGRLYMSDSAAELPRIFIKETKTALGRDRD